MVYFGGVSGVCHDWQFDFDRSFTMHWHVYAQCCRRRLVFGQLDEALHCKTACSWFTPLFFNNFWSKIKWHVWLIHPGLVGVQYIKVLKEYYLRLFLPQSTSWVYVFIIKHFELGSQTRDQSDHLALAFFFGIYKLTGFFCVWKSSVLNSNSNGNVFGLLYFVLSLLWMGENCFALSMFLCVYFPFVRG